MDEHEIQLVKNACAAFGRRDIPALLAMVDPAPSRRPWSDTNADRRDASQARRRSRFFQDLGGRSSSRAP